MNELIDSRMTRLPNGLRIITAAMPRVESVALGIWIDVGGRHEPFPLTGVSHFIEHLLFKGTRRRSARMISQLIEGRGGYLNAFTQEESTCFYARVTAEHAPQALDVLADMYHQPRFAIADLNRERGVIIEEIMMYRDQPQNVVEEMLGELVWPGHPLGRALIGTPESIKKMSRADILGYKGRHYVPSATIVTIAGKVDHDEWVERIAPYWPAKTAKRPGQPVSFNPRQGQGRLAVKIRDVEQVHLALGLRLFGRNDERRYALKLLSVILGENMSSRLFQQVREKHGLAYAVSSSVHLFADTGLLAINAGLDRKHILRALEIIIRETARLKTEPVSAHDLRRARDYAVGQLKLSLESTSSQMTWLGETYLSYGRWVSPSAVIERLTAVTAGDILRVARDVLKNTSASMALITPVSPPGGDKKLQYIVDRLGR